MVPQQVAVIHFKNYQKQKSSENQRNNLADVFAKWAASSVEPDKTLAMMIDLFPFATEYLSQENRLSQAWCLPVILTTQEAEIRNIMVGRQPGQTAQETLSQKYPKQKWAGEGLKWHSSCLAIVIP
jgi:hypothetical protein